MTEATEDMEVEAAVDGPHHRAGDLKLIKICHIFDRKHFKSRAFEWKNMLLLYCYNHMLMLCYLSHF